jgi:hypothetical protein
MIVKRKDKWILFSTGVDFPKVRVDLGVRFQKLVVNKLKSTTRCGSLFKLLVLIVWTSEFP